MAKRRPAATEAPADIELRDGDVVSLGDVLKIQDFYLTNIRPHTTKERLGTFQQLRRAFEAGITPQQIWTAMRNYHADPLRQKAADVAYIKTMRSFFSVANLQTWQKPRDLPKRPTDPSQELLTKLNDFDAIPARPTPPAAQPRLEVPKDDDDFFKL